MHSSTAQSPARASIAELRTRPLTSMINQRSSVAISVAGAVQPGQIASSYFSETRLAEECLDLITYAGRWIDTPR
jgi:hypothetical protein